MRYQGVRQGTFISRPNRFIARVRLDGQEITVHVKNTGRCRELLTEGVSVYLAPAENSERKTAYDLIAVKTARGTVNIDSSAPNTVTREFILSGGIFGGVDLLKAEYPYGASRFDFYAEKGDRRILLETKGVTLFEEDTALFPDAPTERGVKHVRELIEAKAQGYECYLVFVIQAEGLNRFSPNIQAQPIFAEALKEAQAADVHLKAFTCKCTRDTLSIHQEIPIVL